MVTINKRQKENVSFSTVIHCSMAQTLGNKVAH